MSVIIESARNAWNNLINFVMRDERRKNLQTLLQESAKWQPGGEFTNYKTEMETRQLYYLENMESDMREVLKRHFPQTYKDFEKDQVNLPLVKKEIKDKAQVFADSGELELVKEDGEPDEKANELFEEIKGNSGLCSSLKDTDAITQLQHRSMLKFWWDTRKKCVRCSVWPAQLVDIVPNPERWWDVDSAWAVLFTLPGIEGNASTDKRYEVWGFRNLDATELGMSDTVHFTTDGNSDYRYNDEDVNPFEDPREKGKPLYPFVWFQDDKTTELYKLGNTDLLTVNRHINSALTDMFFGMRYSCQPVWVHTKGEGGEDLNVKTMSPATIVDVAGDGDLKALTPTLNITEQWGVMKEVMETRALFGGLSPTAVRADAGPPESGYALKIRNKPIAEHRNNLIEVYRPYVEEAVFRMLVVHNTYSDDKINGIEKLRVKWTPGEIDEIENPSETGMVYAAEIEKDVSTAVDWRMERYDENRDEAETAVEANAEFNNARREEKLLTSPFAQAMDKANGKPSPFEKKDDKDEEEKDKKDKEEDDK